MWVAELWKTFALIFSYLLYVFKLLLQTQPITVRPSSQWRQSTPKQPLLTRQTDPWESLRCTGRSSEPASATRLQWQVRPPCCVYSLPPMPDLSRGFVTVSHADLIKDLVSMCVKARDVAYCPYSHFAVGAALLTADGAIITGNDNAG